MRGSTGFIQERKPRPGDKIKPWDVVRSTLPEDAGVEFDVCRTLVDETAELRYHGDAGKLDGYVFRPLAELRRVPRKKMPAIEGLPKDRPRCAWCNRLLRPLSDRAYEKTAGGATIKVERRTFIRWDAYQEVFHSATCATAFAGAAYRAGYRRTK